MEHISQPNSTMSIMAKTSTFLLSPPQHQPLLSSISSRSIFLGHQLRVNTQKLHLNNANSNRSKKLSFSPQIRAQSTPDYLPDSKFYKVEAILRPWRIQQVSADDEDTVTGAS